MRLVFSFMTLGAGLVGSINPAPAEILSLPVPKTAISANDVISSGSLTERRFRVTAASIAGFATSRGELVGRQARRRLAAGKPVPLLALSSPMLVRRGALVASTFRQDGFSISGSLVALQDGGEGDIISARNQVTGIIVQAAVAADGTLMVSE